MNYNINYQHITSYERLFSFILPQYKNIFYDHIQQYNFSLLQKLFIFVFEGILNCFMSKIYLD